MNEATKPKTTAASSGQVDQIVIRETPLLGWKGSVAIASFCGLFMPVVVYPNDTSLFLCFLAVLGWMGWAMHEWQHKKGYIIK
jgi:hypothetical protein